MPKKKDEKKLDSVIEKAIQSAKGIYKIQSFECKFNSLVYYQYIKILLNLDRESDRYQNMLSNLGQLNNAEQKLLEYAYKKVEDHLSQSKVTLQTA